MIATRTRPRARAESSRVAGHTLGKGLAAAFGAPACALAVGAGLASVPWGRDLTFAVGLQIILPLWVLLACTLPLARDGRTAWGACLALSAPFLLLLVWP